MNTLAPSWLAQEFIDEFGAHAYDLLVATALKHDPKRFEFAMKTAAKLGPLGYDHFCAALHIIERHGCLKSIGDLHHFGKVFDREAVYHWLHLDPVRLVWSVAFNPYRPIETVGADETVADFVGSYVTASEVASYANEISKRAGVIGFGFMFASAFAKTGAKVALEPKLWKLKGKKKPAHAPVTLNEMLKQEASQKLANKLAAKMLAEEAAENATALPKWMPDAQ